jgi:SNF2 family DNA or RNA helicase
VLVFDYRSEDRRAVVSWTPPDADKDWVRVIRDLLVSSSPEGHAEGAFSVTTPWWRFLALRQSILDVITAYGLRSDTDFQLTPVASRLLTEARSRAEGYAAALNRTALSESEVRACLDAARFARPLTPEQLRNIRFLAALPAAATFSVPGAGKTTEALATFLCRREVGDRLLVISPKNAFPAWDEQLRECLPNCGDSFVRLRKIDRIPFQLADDPQFMIINYQQFARVPEVVADHLLDRRVHVFIDESHKIKRRGNVSTEAVLSMSHLPVSKLVMSGTPMPQSVDDMLPQFGFLFPEVAIDPSRVIDAVRPIYVRTTKAELGLPPVTRILKSVPMDPLQARIYQLMRSQVARDASSVLSRGNRRAFQTLGQSVMRVMQLVSHPALLASELSHAHSPELAAALTEGRGPKMRYVLSRARSLAKAGHKVVIWTSFVPNVEYIAAALEDIGAVFIHGKVDTGDESDEDSREGKLKDFHDKDSVMALVANPAAAAEGISLHTKCHHAIYLDRTFNAAHYLQSEDRIHRLGLRPDQTTTIEIVECEGTIDETIRNRLDFKVNQMAAALNDPGLNVTPVPVDNDDEPEDDFHAAGLDPADVAMLAALGGVA